MDRTSQIAVLCCAAILTGCVSQQAVSVSCVKDVPEKPQTRPESEILRMDDYAATLTTWTERLELKGYAEKAAAVIDACR